MFSCENKTRAGHFIVRLLEDKRGRKTERKKAQKLDTMRKQCSVVSHHQLRKSMHKVVVNFSFYGLARGLE